MRRSDVYEARARELAVLAGHDADARVAGPGGKMMPAWCTFRDAARAEHLAAEAAALELPPQTPAFQNAPLKVFGLHDEATIAQMRNCMSVGNVVAGVVCADGHLGYAQPVGGVIAYVKQISISGVTRGGKRMTVATCGLSVRAQRRPSQASVALWAARWATTR